MRGSAVFMHWVTTCASRAAVALVLGCIVLFASACSGSLPTTGSAGAPAAEPTSTASETVAPPLPITGKWYEAVLDRSDAAQATQVARQGARVPAGDAELASESLQAVLTGYATDSASTTVHAVAPQAIATAKVGSLSVMCGAPIVDGGVTKPLWSNMGIGLERARAAAFSGDRFMGEFLVAYDDADPSLSLVGKADGTYSLAERAALVLLWDRFGKKPFYYLVTAADEVPGSWVIGHQGKVTAAVFLGDCSADTSVPSLDARIGESFKAGKVMTEAETADAWSRIVRGFQD